MVRILSGGAAMALVEKTKGAMDVQGTFGAVGAMRDKLLAEEPCDIVILTRALIDALAQQGHVVEGSARDLGVVMTGVAVRKGEPQPDVSTPEKLKAALLAANGIYFPDPQKATAGIHFMKVLEKLGIVDDVYRRIRNFPNGATSMAELANAPRPGGIGCTQVTEILHAPGVALVGLLPKEFELATVYTAAVCTKAQDPQGAHALVAALSGSAAAPLRTACGFH